jgi:hypothetical protein
MIVSTGPPSIGYASPHFSQVAENGSAGLQTGCAEGVLALRDLATP